MLIVKFLQPSKLQISELLPVDASEQRQAAVNVSNPMMSAIQVMYSGCF